MAKQELLEYYKKMRERNIILDFQGAMSQDMLVGMAELIRCKFSQDIDSSMVKRLFSVFIEMAQNIAFYSAEKIYLNNRNSNGEVGVGIIMVSEKNKSYTVTSGNLVPNDAITQITTHCEKINRMDKEELKQFFKEQIKTSRKAGEKGAGVGLIDIARKSGLPIRYEVTPVDHIHSFLVLSVIIQEDIYNE